MKRIKYLLSISVLVLALCIASLGVMAAPPVVIGLQGPITGAWAYEGEMAKQCCEIAAQLINESGGILGGRMIEVRIADDACEPKAGALAAMKLISQKDIVASISTYGSSVTEPASNLYEKFKKVNIAYGATNTRLTEKGLKYFFRTCGIDSAQGIFFADYVPRVFGAKKIAIMHDNTTFAKGVAEETKKALQPKIDAGEVEIVYYDAITPGEKDFSVPLTKLRETHPDVLYFTGYYPEAALVVSQARDIGIDCPFVGGNAAINDEFVKITGIEKAKGCFMTQEPMPAELPYPESKVFLEAYKAKYGEIPSSPWPVYAADALNIIAYAIDKTGSTDSDVLAEYLRSEVDGVPGVTGGIGFTETGDREGVPYLMYVVNEEGTFSIYNK
jgi:branched-chain amino acid transport system substrate-binding protein